MDLRLCRVAPYAAVASLFTVLCTVQYAPRTFLGGVIAFVGHHSVSVRVWSVSEKRTAAPYCK